MNERRGLWFMLTGLVLGIAVGVTAGWSLAPASNVDTAPASLRTDFKDQYRYMIAAAYSANGNLLRARARLGLLRDGNPVSTLGDQSQRMLANNTSQDVVQTLADLSQALQNLPVPTGTSASPQPVASNTSSAITPEPATSTPASPTATIDLSTDLVATDTFLPGTTPTLGDTAAATSSTSTPTPTATPTTLAAPVMTNTPRIPTSTATPSTPFVLTKQATFCDPAQPGLVQIVLQNSSGLPAPGVELIMTWAGGEEHFFTGLKPELGNGYADFVMSPGVEYALSMNAGATRVAKLIAPACTSPGGTGYPGGIHLEFKQQ